MLSLRFISGVYAGVFISTSVYWWLRLLAGPRLF